MTNIFAACKTLDELKREYKRLAKLHHPDVGGDTATMQQINAEFDRLFPIYKLRSNDSGEAPVTHETAESVRSEFYTANGWAGCNYDPARSLKDIAANVRRYVKANYPGYKFSVRTKYASMCQELLVTMKEAPVEIFKTFDQLTAADREQIRRRAERNFVWKLTSWNRDEERAEILRIWEAHGEWYKIPADDIRAVAADVDDYVKSFNREDCDGMIDYFDVNFYYFGCLEDNGSGVKYVPRESARRPQIAGETAQPDEPASAALRVAFCPEHDGVEAYFSGKPSAAVREALKADGWRWHSAKKCWYNRNTEQHLQALRAATEIDALPA